MPTTDAQYIAELEAAWDDWVTTSNDGPNQTPPLTQYQYGMLVDYYIDAVEDARIAHGHPPGPKPRIRP